MRYLIAGVVVGLTLGTAASVGAQRGQTVEPCAHAWIEWSQITSAKGTAVLSTWSPSA